MRQRGVFIEIERVKRIVTKIVEKDIREEIILILNSYKVKQSRKAELTLMRDQEAQQQE